MENWLYSVALCAGNRAVHCFFAKVPALNRVGLSAVFILSAVLAGCGSTPREAGEYGLTPFGAAVFHCNGEEWFSNYANEKVCITRSQEEPNTFLISQDQFEGFTEKYIAIALPKAYLNTYDISGGLSEIYEAVYKSLDDDTPKRWLAAAEHYMRKQYGAKAKMIGFQPRPGLGGYSFEVIPGDQIPPWEETDIPPYVLASETPIAYIRRQIPAGSEPVSLASAVRSPTLNALIYKALRGSVPPGQTSAWVQTEVLDDGTSEDYVASSNRESPPQAFFNN